MYDISNVNTYLISAMNNRLNILRLASSFKQFISSYFEQVNIQ